MTNGLTRSGSWVEANYNNQSSPTTFWDLGSQTDVGTSSRYPRMNIKTTDRRFELAWLQ